MQSKQSSNKRMIINSLLTVTQVNRYSDNIIEITFKSEKPFIVDPMWIGPHLKLMFPDQNGDINFPAIDEQNKVILQAGMREKARTYSIRNYDSVNQMLTVYFVVHKQGLATTWAQSAQVGDRIGLIGLGAKVVFDVQKSVILLGDIAALPAICYSLEHAPENQSITAIIEVRSESDIKPLILPPTKQLTWLVNEKGPSQLPQALNQLMDQLAEKNLLFWGGMEASLTQQIRRQLNDQFTHLTKADIQLISYWRIGYAEGQFKHHD